MSPEIKDESEVVVADAPHLVASDQSDAPALVEQPASIESPASVPPPVRRLEVPKQSTSDLTKTVAINGAMTLVNGAAFLAFAMWWWMMWMQVVHAIIRGAGGAQLELASLKFTWLTLLTPYTPQYWWLGFTMLGLLLLSSCWTTLHIVRNKPLGALRWPYLALVWLFTLGFPFPAANLAYSAFGFSDAMWAGVELSRRTLRGLARRTIGEVDPKLESADAMACSAVFLGVACIPICFAIAYSCPAFVVGINVYALLGFLHAFWYRRITRCLADDTQIRWQTCDVTMLNEHKLPVIQVALPTRDEKFIVRHTGELPLELMQFDRHRPRSARIGFDITSNRPVALQVGGLTFPLIKSFFRLP